MLPHRCCALLALLLGGCLPLPDPPAVELDLYDEAVTCDSVTGACTGPDGAVATPEYHRAPVRLRERAPSAGYPGGLLTLSLRLSRPGGRVAQLELEIPADVEARGSPPRVSYSESGPGGAPAFRAARASGRIELSWGRSCPCQTGRFELLLEDPCPDGKLDTADDRERRLSRGRLRRGPTPFCHGRAVLAIKPGLLVVGSRACPVRSKGSSSGSCAWDWGLGGWAVGWNDDGWYDEGWDGEWDEPGWADDWDDGEWTDDPGDGYWGDDGWYDDWSEEDDWDNPSSGWGGSGSDDSWGDDWGDDSWDDGGDDWGDDWWSDDSSSDDSWSDDGWSDDGDDWGDDGDDGDDWGDDWWED